MPITNSCENPGAQASLAPPIGAIVDPYDLAPPEEKLEYRYGVYPQENGSEVYYLLIEGPDPKRVSMYTECWHNLIIEFTKKYENAPFKFRRQMREQKFISKFDILFSRQPSKEVVAELIQRIQQHFSSSVKNLTEVDISKITRQLCREKPDAFVQQESDEKEFLNEMKSSTTKLLDLPVPELEAVNNYALDDKIKECFAKATGSHEGFWASGRWREEMWVASPAHPENATYPVPTPTGVNVSSELALFMARFETIQKYALTTSRYTEVAQSDGETKEHPAFRFKVRGEAGASECRCCSSDLVRVGNKEFTDTNTDITWPEGYFHYLDRHNVMPTERFYDYVMSVDFNSQLSKYNKNIGKRQRTTPHNTQSLFTPCNAVAAASVVTAAAIAAATVAFTK